MPTAEDILRSLTGMDQAIAKSPFSKLLPYDQFVNIDLLRAIAEGRIMPEENLTKRLQLDELDTAGVDSGAYRTGRFLKKRAMASDSLDRNAQERVNNFYQPMVDEMTNRYRTLYESYTKDPASDLMKKIDLLTPKYNQIKYEAPKIPEILNPFLTTTSGRNPDDVQSVYKYRATLPSPSDTLSLRYQ